MAINPRQKIVFITQNQNQITNVHIKDGFKPVGGA